MKDFFKGECVTEASIIGEKLQSIKAFVFDWDGVFNNGEKTDQGCSFFNEVDAMGTNLLRFNHWLKHKSLPFTAIITGENNKSSFQFAEREQFHSLYYGAKNKLPAIEDFCKKHSLKLEEVSFIFDDVLDFGVAEKVGLRLMMGGESRLALQDFAKRRKLVDYMTYFGGGNHGLREVTDFLMVATGNYDETITERMNNTDQYKSYLDQRYAVKAELVGPNDPKKIGFG